MKAGFDPNNGFFETTESHELIPKSKAWSHRGIYTDNEFYTFIGKMLSKAVYSEILLEPQFSPVFLNQLLGRSNQLDDMVYLDRRVFLCAFVLRNRLLFNNATQFYRSLVNIKHMLLQGENIEDLCLSFTVFL